MKLSPLLHLAIARQHVLDAIGARNDQELDAINRDLVIAFDAIARAQKALGHKPPVLRIVPPEVKP